jgi:asparagine synthase (glutamine-hydrolysing)
VCGIAGFLSLDSSRSDGLPALERMTAAIAHRGPDDSGFYSRPGVFVGHRRLSIVDVAGGLQPMSNENGRVWIAFNGEIFNHSDLRPPLEAAGHHYRTRCDTETILHAYEQYGSDCVSRFRGMFAFAIWDENTETLFCARDRLGIKPFYYFYDGKTFAFASEIKALLAHPAISAGFEDSLLAEHLAFGYVSSEQTLFRGIRKLMPGHHLTVRRRESSGPRIERYWEVQAPERQESRPDAEWISDCRQKFEEAVRTRLMSDVPLGVFLSGGVDSSAIASMVTRLTPGDRLKTFSVGYAEEQYSELAWARQVSQIIGSEHREVTVGMEDFFDILPKLVWHEDEPITWPSSVSLYYVSELASHHVKVVLTGEGSDELFGGYERYQHFLWNQRWMAWYGLFPRAFREFARRRIEDSPLIGASLRRKAQHTFLGRQNTVESLQLDNFYCAFSEAEQRSLLKNTAPAGTAYSNFLTYWNARRSSSPLSQMLYADQKTYLVELLMKQDQMSMATSIESRVPFLDHQFVEFAAQAPDHLKIRGGVAKYILKKAVEDLLPHDIIYRKKMGFPTPVRSWLRDERAKPLFARLLDPEGLLASYLDRRAIRSLIERHQNGMEDATDRIWRLLNLQLWGDLFLNGKSNSRWEGLLSRASVVL